MSRPLPSLLSLSALLLLAVSSLVAQSASPSPMETAKEEPIIQDNSFLVEEAYNQEDGVVQHINFFQWMSSSRSWVYTMTDEWPLRTQKHQFSMTMAATHGGDYEGSGMGWGDTALNYRYQLVGSGETKVAIAPRFTLLAPTGDSRVGRGYGGTGFQTNIPVSIAHTKHLVTHWNAGATWIPRAQNDTGDHAGTVGVNLGQSFIYQVTNRFNLMMETYWTSTENVIAAGKTERKKDLFLSPGARWAYNLKNGTQIVPGIAVPVGAGSSAGEKGVIMYLSIEHPLAWAHSRN